MLDAVYQSAAVLNDVAQKTKAKAIGFRPGVEFRAELEALALESRWSMTDILESGFRAFWPDLKALVLAAGHQPPTPEQASKLRARLKRLAALEALEVNVDDVLDRALIEAGRSPQLQLLDGGSH